MGGSHALPLITNCRPQQEEQHPAFPVGRGLAIAQSMKDCHTLPIKSHYTLNSQFTPVDILVS